MASATSSPFRHIAGLCLAAVVAVPAIASAAPTADEFDDARSQLYRAYHQRWVRGDIDAARAGLKKLLARQDAPDVVRAKAALWLGEIAELKGQKRLALAHLDRAKTLAGSQTALARQAEDRRARIVSTTPLADVRGPVPGSVRLRDTAAVNVAFRGAEKLLAIYHRVVVQPKLENIDSVRRGKRAALARAVAAYERVAKQGGPAAQAASRFRIAAMYHHMAEALAFDRPPEMLPDVARRLARELRGESIGYLRRALVSYRAVARIAESAETRRWRRLAQREVQTLAGVLKERKADGKASPRKP